MQLSGMYPLSNQKPTPKFFILNLVTSDQMGQSHLFMFACVAMTEQEAYLKAVNTMKTTIPELYNISVSSGRGFEIASVQELTFSQLKKSFDAYINPPPKIKFVLNEEKPPEETLNEKNLLIKQIIETRDRALLEANKENLTDYEIAYITDTIK